MTKKLYLGVLIILVTICLLASCTTTSPTSSTTTETSTTTPSTTISTQSHWWDSMGTPKYGGTITIQTSMQGAVFDPWVATPSSMLYPNEPLVAPDWALDREVWAMNTPFVPAKYYMGLLAESWQKTDPTTLVINLRHGVHWQNKPPVNGREFVADDVVQHYNRIMGIGSGYSNPSPLASQLSLVESITAADKYTVTFKLKSAGIMAVYQIFDQTNKNQIESPEAAKATNVVASPDSTAATQGLGDWHNAAGTGAWMLDDFVAGASVTLNKNPDYWGYDERHPDNKLPYADTLKILVIPDQATTMAGVRSGQIDYVQPETAIGWQQVQAMSKTNPEIKQISIFSYGTAIDMRCDKTPFSDINVRKAMNMAIDRKSIASGYYGGTVDGTPCGMFSPTLTGYCYPYADWSQDVKDVYNYNPTTAKKLLADAGYPDGFKTNVYAPTIADTNLLQLVKSELSDINIDMTINTMDFISFQAFIVSMKHDQMVDTGYPGTGAPNPLNALYFRTSTPGSINPTASNDAGYDALATKLESVTTEEEIAQVMIDIDKYTIEHYWAIYVIPVVNYALYQPSLKGYMGDSPYTGGSPILAMASSRWWKDGDTK